MQKVGFAMQIPPCGGDGRSDVFGAEGEFGEAFLIDHETGMSLLFWEIDDADDGRTL